MTESNDTPKSSENMESVGGVSNGWTKARSTMKSGIKSGVDGLNDVLASSEVQYTSIVSRLSTSSIYMRRLGERSMGHLVRYYSVRRDYGVEAVVGSTVVIGGLTGLRRGRIQGAAAGILAGSLAYGFAYGLPQYTVDEKAEKQMGSR